MDTAVTFSHQDSLWRLRVPYLTLLITFYSHFADRQEASPGRAPRYVASSACACFPGKGAALAHFGVMSRGLHFL